jgi:hypothetical protein
VPIDGSATLMTKNDEIGRNAPHSSTSSVHEPTSVSSGGADTLGSAVSVGVGVPEAMSTRVTEIWSLW